MPSFFLSYTVVLGLVAVIIGLVMTSLLFRLRHKDNHTWWLCMLFITLTAMMAAFGVLLSVPEPWTITLLYAIIMIDLGVLCLIQFAYSFPTVSQPREARTFLIANLVLLPFMFLVLMISLRFDEDGFALDFGSWIGFALGAQVLRLFMLLWLVGIWIRKISALERKSPRSWLARIVFPRNKTAKSIRAFVGSFSIALVLPLALLLELTGVIKDETSTFLFSFAIVMLFSVFFISYINYMPEQSSFMMKLVGMTLVAVLLAIAMTGFFATLFSRERYHADRLDDMEACRAYVQGRRNSVPGTVRYIISRLPEETEYRVHYQRDNDFDPAGLESIEARMRARRDAIAEVTAGWPHQLDWIARDWSVEKDGTPVLGQVLQRGADLDVFMAREHDVHYDFMHDGRLYQTGFSYMAFRAHMHELHAKTALVMLLASVGVLLFYPIFIDRAVTRPVAALIRGLHLVNAGRLDVRVPVHAHDEIGYVANAFNHMVGSIAEAREKALHEERERVALEAENARKTKELEEARRLQLSMLPATIPQLEGLMIAAYTDPATEVGGDYYDFHMNGEVLTVAIGDATGHGLQAGTMVSATKGLFQALAPNLEPIPFLDQTSAALARMGFKTMFMAMQVARLRGDRLVMTSAGMPYALIHRESTGEVEQILLRGLPLGSGIDFPYQQQDINFGRGDTLLLHSDGLEERFNPKGEMLGSERVHATFGAVAGQAPAEIIDHLVGLGRNWAGTRPNDDDTTFVVLKKT